MLSGDLAQAAARYHIARGGLVKNSSIEDSVAWPITVLRLAMRCRTC
jgi:hypothetical protein